MDELPERGHSSLSTPNCRWWRAADLRIEASHMQILYSASIHMEIPYGDTLEPNSGVPRFCLSPFHAQTASVLRVFLGAAVKHLSPGGPSFSLCFAEGVWLKMGSDLKCLKWSTDRTKVAPEWRTCLKATQKNTHGPGGLCQALFARFCWMRL